MQRPHSYGVSVYGSKGAPSRSALIWNARNREKSLDIPKSPDVCQIAGSIVTRLALKGRWVTGKEALTPMALPTTADLGLLIPSIVVFE